MKKILLIGKFNTVVNETNQFLSQYFHVQLCSENAGVLEGMLKIVNPDLVLISLIGAYDIDTSIFFLLSDQYAQIPVLTIGTKEESGKFFKYYEGEQFENLIRPVENTTIMNAVCRRLGLEKASTQTHTAQTQVKYKNLQRSIIKITYSVLLENKLGGEGILPNHHGGLIIYKETVTLQSMLEASPCARCGVRLWVRLHPNVTSCTCPAGQPKSWQRTWRHRRAR